MWTCRGGDPDPDVDADTVLDTTVEKTDCCGKKTDKLGEGGVGKKQTGAREANKQTDKQTRNSLRGSLGCVRGPNGIT